MTMIMILTMVVACFLGLLALEPVQQVLRAVLAYPY